MKSVTLKVAQAIQILLFTPSLEAVCLTVLISFLVNEEPSARPAWTT